LVGIAPWLQLIAQQAAAAVCVAANAQPNVAWSAIARAKTAISVLRISIQPNQHSLASQLSGPSPFSDPSPSRVCLSGARRVPDP
jgi:hypothetical protein